MAGGSVSLDTSGLDNLIRNLGRDMERAAEESRQQIARSAREKAPVKSGRLRESIAVVGDEVQVQAPYAEKAEARQPFLEPAIRDETPAFERALEAVVRRLTGD